MTKGDYYRPHPLDFELLRRLQPEGAMLGYKTLASTVGQLAIGLNEGVPDEARLTSPEVAARLRSMEAAGYVTTVTLIGSTNGKNRGWQRTPKGDRHLADHDKGGTDR